MMPSPTDTQEKIVYKDHDILISTHTLLQDSLRRQDEDRGSAQENRQLIFLELKTIAVEQARISTEIANSKNDNAEMSKRMDGLESKSIRMDLIAYVGMTIAGVIAWFKH